MPTAIVGAAAYLTAGEADLLAGLLISAGAVPGALLGSALLKRLPVAALRWMFIVFILAIAARLVLIPPPRGGHVPFEPLIGAGYVLLGLVMGVLSGLLGIGGGIVAVPALVGVFGISDLVAKGTSLLVMIPTSLVGTVANWRARTVRVGDGLVVGAAATVASLPGAALALALPPQLSTTLFAALLLVVAAQLTWSVRCGVASCGPCRHPLTGAAAPSARRPERCAIAAVRSVLGRLVPGPLVRCWPGASGAAARAPSGCATAP